MSIKRIFSLAALISAVGLFAVGCSGSSDAGLSDEAKRGKALFVGAGECANCHDVDSGIRITGPTLKGIASTKDAAFLRESILSPNKDVTAGFSANLMPGDFGNRLSEQQINDVVAYLLTLK